MRQILVVEDDDDLREVMALTLMSSGYSIIEARCGEEALVAIEQAPQPPCLVLLDLMMPGMSGVQVLDVLRTTGKLERVPVVVLSALADSCRPPGAVGYVTKPVARDKLLGIVRTCSSH